MDTQVNTEPAPSYCETLPETLELMAPRPLSLQETGLTLNFLQELVAKHLYDGGAMDSRELVARLALAGPILEEILGTMRTAAYIEVRGPAADSHGLRYALTDRGRAFAAEALAQSGYIGPAPVPLDRYSQIINAQSVHLQKVTRTQMRELFADVVINQQLLDQLGSAMRSGRAIFLYGPAGTGKTYMGERLAWLLGDAILVPHAIALGDAVVQIFDPAMHRPVGYLDDEPELMLHEGFDPRFVLCRRPAVISGGELTLDMLEIQYDPATRQYQAPLQLKANNGIYMIDDLGRQRVATVDLFNRWIVPMESRQDYLSLSSGKRFEIPFDVVLMFSTNMNPMELADDAFLRRLGHKIHFDFLQADDYAAIWRQVCDEHGISFDPELLRYVLQELHIPSKIPLLPCHPRDLLGMALDYSRYQEHSGRLTPHALAIAWANYFIDLNVNPDHGTTWVTQKTIGDHHA
ncbi:MAG: AAA family ATPase [Pseudomonadota bacterium]